MTSSGKQITSDSCSMRKTVLSLAFGLPFDMRSGLDCSNVITRHCNPTTFFRFAFILSLKFGVLIIPMALGCLFILTDTPLAVRIITQYFPGRKKIDMGGQGGDTLEEDGMAEDGPALEGPADDEDFIRVEVVVVDPATIVDPADGLKVQEKMRAGVLLCVEFCNAVEADGLEEFNPDDDG